jgi:hypothetical protein
MRLFEAALFALSMLLSATACGGLEGPVNTINTTETEDELDILKTPVAESLCPPISTRVPDAVIAMGGGDVTHHAPATYGACGYMIEVRGALGKAEHWSVNAEDLVFQTPGLECDDHHTSATAWGLTPNGWELIDYSSREGGWIGTDNWTGLCVTVLGGSFYPSYSRIRVIGRSEYTWDHSAAALRFTVRG